MGAQYTWALTVCVLCCFGQERLPTWKHRVSVRQRATFNWEKAKSKVRHVAKMAQVSPFAKSDDGGEADAGNAESQAAGGEGESSVGDEGESKASTPAKRASIVERYQAAFATGRQGGERCAGVVRLRGAMVTLRGALG